MFMASFPYALIGAALGAAVIAFAIRSLAIPVAVFGGIAMIMNPRLAYYGLVASIPIYFGFASGTRFQMAILLPLLFFMCINACVGRGPWPVVLRWPETHLAVVFCAAALASLGAASNPYFSGLAMVGVYAPMAFVFFATLAFVEERRNLERVLWLLMGMGVVESILAVIETRFGLVFSLLLLKERVMGISEVDGTLGAVGTTWHPSVLGGYLMMIIPIALYQIVRRNPPVLRLAALAASGVTLYGFWLTYSRLAILGLATSAAAFVLLRSRLARYSALGLAIVFFVLLAFEDFSLSALVHDIESTLIPESLKRGGRLFNSAWYALSYRFETWGIAWNMFLSNPLLGAGMGETARGWVPEFLPQWATTWGPITSPEEPNAGVTHNAFLGILAEHGILAFTAFVAIWVWAIRCLVLATADADLRPYALLLGAILSGQFMFMMMTPIVRDFSLTVALAIALGRISQRRRPAVARPETSEPPLHRHAAAAR